MTTIYASYLPMLAHSNQKLTRSSMPSTLLTLTAPVLRRPGTEVEEICKTTSLTWKAEREFGSSIGPVTADPTRAEAVLLLPLRRQAATLRTGS